LNYQDIINVLYNIIGARKKQCNCIIALEMLMVDEGRSNEHIEIIEVFW